MIEEGLTKFVQSDAGVATIAASGGGFLAELPKGQGLPSWTYLTVSDPPGPSRTLTTVSGLQFRRVQIDCFGNSAADVIRLGAAIGRRLNGFKGTFPDVDQTIVDSVFLSDVHDPEFDATSRTWRRVLEFQVNYVSQF